MDSNIEVMGRISLSIELWCWGAGAALRASSQLSRLLSTPYWESLPMTKIASHKIASHKIISTPNTLTYPASGSDCNDDTFVVILTKTYKTLAVMRLRPLSQPRLRLAPKQASARRGRSWDRPRSSGLHHSKKNLENSWRGREWFPAKVLSGWPHHSRMDYG